MNLNSIPKLHEDIISQIKDFPKCKHQSTEQKLLINKLIPNEELKERYKKYGLCKECSQPNTGANWCQPCNSNHFQQDFNKWTSGNEEIDKFIQESQLNAICYQEVLEWISYDKFNDIEYLAQGDFNTVYKAEWIDGYILNWDIDQNKWEKPDENIDVVLKYLKNNPQEPTRDVFQEITFYRKFGVSAPIISCFGISQNPITKNFMIVMQYAPNGSMKRFLKSNHNILGLDDKLYLFRNIVDGLKEVHNQGYIHGNLHSGSILSFNKDTCFISDFRSCKSAREQTKYDERKIFGILPYVAPEVLRNKIYTQPADIYSFGVVACEILSELPPYHDLSHDKSLALKICQGLRPKLSNFKIPLLLGKLIVQCLDADPLKRPTADELSNNLSEWIFGVDYNEVACEFYKQFKEAEEFNKLTSSSKSITSLNTYTIVQPQEIYHRRLLDYKNLPVNFADEKWDILIKKVSEMHDTMQRLQSENHDKSVSQKKIDNIFNEVPLPFNDYQEADELPRTERLRKYIHIKTLEEFAFKTVDKDHVDQVKNQVTILKKIQTCQNVIRFYGITEDTDNADTDDSGKIVKKYYLITEWAEKGDLYEYIIRHQKNGQNIDSDLKLRFAFDIAKGLNFLNTLKIVHRDIRSENVVIMYDDVAKITNFKLSRGYNEATGNLQVSKESARHNAPEMLRRGLESDNKPKSKKKQKYDTNCEVYSFGILLWELAECKIAYQGFEDFVMITEKVMEGYREPFSPNTDIPEKYKQLVTRAVDDDPGNRPTFANMLIDLQDPLSNESSYSSNTSNTPDISSTYKPKPSLVRKESLESLTFSWNPQTMTVDEAEKHQYNNTKDKKELYKCFDFYAMIDNPKGKYWKAYYITKGWSDLTSSPAEKNEIATELYKEVADYGDEFPEAQLRYASMIMRQKGPTDEAIEYLLKSAKNGHPVAMFNIAGYYFSRGNEELGRYYMTKSANHKYKDAIKYCKEKNIPLI